MAFSRQEYWSGLLPSQLIPPSPSSAVPTSPFSMSGSLFLRRSYLGSGTGECSQSLQLLNQNCFPFLSFGHRADLGWDPACRGRKKLQFLEVGGWGKEKQRVLSRGFWGELYLRTRTSKVFSESGPWDLTCGICAKEWGEGELADSDIAKPTAIWFENKQLF